VVRGRPEHPRAGWGTTTTAARGEITGTSFHSVRTARATEAAALPCSTCQLVLGRNKLDHEFSIRAVLNLPWILLRLRRFDEGNTQHLNTSCVQQVNVLYEEPK
jgi:hypothetical protein